MPEFKKQQEENVLFTLYFLSFFLNQKNNTSISSRPSRKSVLPSRSNYVLEAESAVAREPFAFAPATQILTMRPLWVNMAHFDGTGASRLFAGLMGRKKHVSLQAAGHSSANFYIGPLLPALLT